MDYIDKKVLGNNCSNDVKIEKDLLRMGLVRLKESLEITEKFMQERSWNVLADCIHRLRPVINFCGIVFYEDTLFSMEKSIKENNADAITEKDLSDLLDFLKGAITAVEKELG